MSKIQDAIAEAAALQKALDKLDEKQRQATDRFNEERQSLWLSASPAAGAILKAAGVELA